MKGAIDELKSGAKDTPAALHSELQAAKEKVAEMKADAEASKARLLELAEGKKAEVEEQVAEWKAKHQKDALKSGRNV